MQETKVFHGNIDFGNKLNEPFVLHKEIFDETSPRSPLSTRTSDSIDLEVDECVDTSIEHLYHDNYSPSKRSFISYGEESGIDSQMRFYAGCRTLEVTKEVVLENENGSENKNSENKDDTRLGNTESISSVKSKKPLSGKTKPKKDENDNSLEAKYIGSYLLKQSRDLVSSGDNSQKALDLALGALKSFEKCTNEEPNLDLVMCLHVVATLYCKLGKYNEAISLLQRAVDIPNIDEGQSHALAKFAGCMQLGDTYAMLGLIEISISFYTDGLEIQRQALGEKDPKIGETCRYVAEAHVQLVQFDEAEKLCQLALDIHSEKGSSLSLQEALDRRLMGHICDSKGDYETALKHYLLGRMAMSANGHEKEAALIDISIGDAYSSLARYGEAIFEYQKVLSSLKSTEGENHPLVASVVVRLADLYNKIGKYKESKSYCEHALFIYSKPSLPMEDTVSGLVNISAIYESMNEFEKALELLLKVMKVYKVPAEKELGTEGQKSAMAGIQARMGVLYYLMGSYRDSYASFKNAVLELRDIEETKSAFFGLVLNQMGLACVQIYAIHEAAALFEESRNILEKEYGPYHTETLAVCSNLAGTYDAMGRSSDAIEILEYVVGVREQKLGTANPDGDDEKRRLAELLKEAGRMRNRKSRSLETLLETNYQNIEENEIKDL